MALPPKHFFTDHDDWDRDGDHDKDHDRDRDKDFDDAPGFFTDHVDVRPTMMLLLGIPDEYQHDGRVIAELLHKMSCRTA